MGVKVSVATITYNHEAHIAQAIEGALMQEGDFGIEMVIGEDCSTDGTLEIVRSYVARFPDKIHLVTSDHNVGAMRNFVRTLDACTGEYVALLEGDDYWTVPDKLRRQVEYLDTHPDCALCFHDVDVVYDDGSQRPSRRFVGAGYQEVSGIEDLLVSNFIPTCSAVFRRALLPDPLPDWYTSLKLGDLVIHILLAERGWIGYIDEVMGVYRQHGGGVWTSSSQVRQLEGWIEALQVLDQHLGGRYTTRIARTLFGLHSQAFRELIDVGDVPSARGHARGALRAALRCRPLPLRDVALVLAEGYAPRALRAVRAARRTLRERR